MRTFSDSSAQNFRSTIGGAACAEFGFMVSLGEHFGFRIQFWHPILGLDEHSIQALGHD